MRFFDTTPTGVILNRFSKDQQTVDVSMRMSLGMLCHPGNGTERKRRQIPTGEAGRVQ